MSKLISIATMIFTVGLAFYLDHWLETLRKQIPFTLDPYMYFWAGVGIDLIFVLVLGLLAWLVIFRFGKSRVIPLISMIVGLALIVYPTLLLPLLPPSYYLAIRTTVLYPLHIALAFSSPQKFLSLTRVALTVIGLMSLMRPLEDSAKPNSRLTQNGL